MTWPDFVDTYAVTHNGETWRCRIDDGNREHIVVADGYESFLETGPRVDPPTKPYRVRVTPELASTDLGQGVVKIEAPPIPGVPLHFVDTDQDWPDHV